MKILMNFFFIFLGASRDYSTESNLERLAQGQTTATGASRINLRSPTRISAVDKWTGYPPPERGRIR
jgi:hypothetical protein